MQQSDTDSSNAAIEQKVRELVSRERILTFTTLTTKLPGYTWIKLLKAVNHLEKQHVIRLTPLPWDHQILLTPNTSTTAPLKTD